MRDNILKDVYAQDKVELSAMDVQLGLVDESKKYLDLYKTTASYIDGVANRLEKTKKELDLKLKDFESFKTDGFSAINKYKDSYDKTGILLNNLNKQAKDLGLNTSDIPTFTQLTKLHQDLINSVTKLESIINKVK